MYHLDISIIIPVYNVEYYLEDCLNSLINQEFKGEIEMICVNDGSTDGSLDILNRYIELDPRIIVISQDNAGLSAARNTGLKHAKGKFLMFIDSDDSLKHNNSLSKMFYAAEQEETDILIADFEFDYEDKTKNHIIQRDPSIINKRMSGKEYLDKEIKKKCFNPVVWNKLYNRNFLENNNLFFLEGVLYEDNEFTPRALYLAESVRHISDVVYLYRQRTNSIMNTNGNINRIGDYLLVADSLKKFNTSYQSSSVLNIELLVYLTVLRTIKVIEDNDFKNELRKEIEKRRLEKDFIYRLGLNISCFLFIFLCINSIRIANSHYCFMYQRYRRYRFE